MLRIGMTYDLREEYRAAGYGEEETAEFDSPETIDALERALAANGVAPVRIGHIRSLAQRLAAGERWDFVFNICEGLSGAGREAQVPALLEAYGIPCSFSDSLVMALCLHKGLTKHVLRDKGIPTAPFAVIETMADLDGFTLPFPVFAKPVAEGTGKGVSPASRAENPAALRRSCRNLMSRFRQPVLVETFLPGREFTVGMIGTGRHAESIAVLEVLLDGPRRGGCLWLCEQGGMREPHPLSPRFRRGGSGRRLGGAGRLAGAGLPRCRPGRSALRRRRPAAVHGGQSPRRAASHPFGSADPRGPGGHPL